MSGNMTDKGTLEKLVIKAFKTPDYDCSSYIDEFEAFINPSEITLSYEMDYDSSQGPGTTGSRMEFSKLKPGDMTLTLFIDGTGANGYCVDVQKQVEKFKSITSYNGDIHRTNYLLIGWGTLSIKRCVLKKVTIAYKMFKPSGIPLRALITADFTDNSDDKSRVALAQDKSSDLTHIHLVKGGDTLPGLCYQIYGDFKYYIEVARVNQIDNFRNILPGTKLFFPPLEK
jgi:LysM repeat protein